MGKTLGEPSTTELIFGVETGKPASGEEEPIQYSEIGARVVEGVAAPKKTGNRTWEINKNNPEKRRVKERQILIKGRKINSHQPLDGNLPMMSFRVAKN